MKKLIKKYQSKPHQLRVLDLLQVLILVALVGSVGAYKLNSSNALSSINIKGKIVDQNGRAAPGITVGCTVNTKTDSNGIYTATVPANTTGGTVPTFCLRVSSSGLPSGFSSPVATNSRAGQSTYEWQVAGLSCYLNTTYCGPGKPFSTPNETIYYDVSTDTAYDWKVTYTDKVAPSAPGLNGSAEGTSKINLIWYASTDNYSGIKSYYVYRNNTKVGATTNNYYTDSNLSSGTTYAYYVKAIDGAGNSKSSNIVSLTTLKPNDPIPTPTPTPGGGGGGSSSGSGSGSSGSSSSGGSRGTGSTVSLYSGTSISPAKVAADKTPPSAPSGLTATVDFGHKTIGLEWKEAKDNVGVSGYQVERSSDNKKWEILTSSVSETFFEDLTPSFGAVNYYRVQAIDVAGNRSKYVGTQTKAANFEPNVFKDQDSVVIAEDSLVAYKIPANTVQADLFCDLRISADSLGATVPKFRQVQGPYEIVCRDSNGTAVDVLTDNSVQAVVDKGKINNGKKISTAYFGQNSSGDWERLAISSADKKTNTETIDLSGHNLFSIMTPIKSGSVWLVLLKILIFLLVIVFGTLFFLRFRLKQKLESQYNDYLHQSRGF